MNHDSKSLPDSGVENYVLDAKKCLPHITLLMGLIERKQVPQVSHKVDKVTEKFSALNLTLVNTKISVSPNGQVVSGLEIEKTTELLKLHETILDELNLIFTYEGIKTTMFYSPPPVNEVSMFWVKGFAKTSVRANYKPHITLGLGELKQKIAPVKFSASRLALCHLGNYCTCRKILWSISLG